MKQIVVLLWCSMALFAMDVRLRDYPEAMMWEVQAMEGNTEAMFNLAYLYQTEIKDDAKAIDWYTEAYEMDGDGDSASNLGYIYDTRKEYESAILWYKRASELGDKVAAFSLGRIYDEALKEPKQAVTYYTLAVERGEPSAALRLGVLYQNHYKDYGKAMAWYTKAYEMGNAFGASGVGHLYYNEGDSVRGAAYLIAMIDQRYPKATVLKYLSGTWKLSKEQIAQAYELQQTLDIPKHYHGDLD